MRLIITLFLFIFVACGISAKDINFKTGKWNGELYLNEKDTLPFSFNITKTNKQYTFTIINAEERIDLLPIRKSSDTLILDFPSFHSSLYIYSYSKNKLKGFWQNFNRSGNYKIPFILNYSQEQNAIQNPLECQLSNDLSGKWKTTFDHDSKNPSMAIGVFKQKNKYLTGTFLTETGDYRYLQGFTKNNKMLLSCFDGSHAFLFKADVLEDGTLKGTFNSGSHYKGNWIANRDDKFELGDPDSLTFQTTNNFRFSVLDMNGKTYNYPEMSKGKKLTIIQIMGTWCPNCMDEMKYFKSLYDKYGDENIEFISVAYEVGEDFETYKSKIILLQERYNYPFQILIGGKADKKLAASQFPDLNNIISFPTSIFLDQSGKVIKIHTGFNGPGTNDVFKEYQKNTELFIEKTLNN